MATITFHANAFAAASSNDGTLIEHTAGSGLGFYGDGFGLSVPVGQYQDNTYISNSNGTASGIKVGNTKYMSVSGASHNGGTTLDNEAMPNYYAPLNVRFSHSEGVRVQNCKLRIFDRNDIANQASGVTTQVYEIRHPHPVEVNNEGSGALTLRGRSTHDWEEFDPELDQLDMDFTSSPGISGLNTSAGDTLPAEASDGFLNWNTNEGAAHKAERHDWYIALSASPDSIGSKTDYGLYFTLEYL